MSRVIINFERNLKINVLNYSTLAPRKQPRRATAAMLCLASAAHILSEGISALQRESEGGFHATQGPLFSPSPVHLISAPSAQCNVAATTTVSWFTAGLLCKPNPSKLAVYHTIREG